MNKKEQYKVLAKRRSIQLGMSHASARARLTKTILYKLLKQCGEDICFKCSNPIKTIEELSIEHKLPWENVDPALFFDLNNVAFSHLKCNRNHTFNKNKDRQINSPEGLAWCRTHKAHLPIKEFTKNFCKRNGLDNDCKQCRKINRAS